MKKHLLGMKKLFCLVLFLATGLVSMQAQAPQIDQTPEDLSYETYGFGMVPLTDWVDNNGGALITPAEDCGPATWTNDFDMDNFNTECGFYSGNITVTFTYTDACDNSLSFTRTATLFDNTAPSCIKPADLTIDCSDPEFEETVEFYAGYWGPVTDLNHPITVVSSYDEDGFDENGQQEITWTFTDACGNVSTRSAVLTVTGNCDYVLVVTPPTNLTLECDETVPAPAVVATTTCPDGIINVVESESVNTMDCPGNFIITRTYEVSDNCGNSETVTQTITVMDTTAPVFSFVPEDTNIEADCTGETEIFGTPSVGDACGEVNLTFEDTTNGTGDCDVDISITRVWTATDQCGNTSTASQTVTVTDNTAPVFTFVPAGADVNCEAYPDGFGTPVVEDACTEVTLTFEDTLEPYICDADFNITRVWTATDACGNSATASQTLIVWPDLEAPLFSFVPADMTITCPETPVFGTPEISDACTGFTVSEAVSSTGSCPEGYTTTITWTAIDGCGNASVQSQTITVLAAPAPIVIAFSDVPANKTIACGEELAFGQPTCNSNCDAGYSIEVSNQTVEGTCSGNAVHTRTWTATDACGNVAECKQVITVLDETAPEFTATPGDKTIWCGDEIIFSTPATADLCGGVTLTFADETTSESCDNVAYSVTRTWTAADACGNVSEFNNTISVVDNEKPTFNIQSQQITLTPAAYAAWELPEVNAFDECTSVTLNEPVIHEYSDTKISYSWRAIDACGNKAAVTITVILVEPTNGGFGTSINNFDLGVFPNPAIQNLVVSFNSEEATEAANLEVVNMSGQVQMTQSLELFKGQNTTTLDLHNLVSGSYFVRLNINGKQQVTRFIKM